jgi:DNA-binding response OmpR family regulator
MADILFIEDDELVRQSLTLALRSAGHAVHAARDGREGMEKFSSVNPDVIITDIIMPNQEGIETIIEIRKMNSTLPIVAISGAGGSDTIDFLKAATVLGATKVLRKPFGASALVDAVDECLRDRRDQHA